MNAEAAAASWSAVDANTLSAAGRAGWAVSDIVFSFMLAPMRWRTAAGIAALMAATGCSLGYEVMATVINGRLAFVSMNDDYTCITNVQVTAEDGTRAQPSPGDDVGLVVNGGVFWWTKAQGVECTTDFPIFYGAPVPGTTLTVAPKSLQVGVVYAVHTGSPRADGYGCFRITQARRVENLPDERCNPQ